MAQDWISNLITAARADSKLISQSMADRLENLIRTDLIASVLSAGQLNTLAASLIADINSTIPKEEVEK